MDPDQDTLRIYEKLNVGLYKRQNINSNLITFNMQLLPNDLEYIPFHKTSTYCQDLWVFI